MIRNRSNRRGALVWAAVFFLVALLSWAMNFQLRSVALRGAFVGTELEAQMILAAESAADEIVLNAARAANTRGDLATALRAPTFAKSGAPVPAKVARSTPLTDEMLARLDTGGARLALRASKAEIQPEPGAPAGEVRAVLTVTVKIEGWSGRRCATRTLTRRHPMRISTMGVPAPFSETALYIEDATPIVLEVEAMVDSLDALLNGRLKDLTATLDEADGEIAEDQRARRDALSAWLAARRARPTPKAMALLVSPRTTQVADLAALIPRARWSAAQQSAADASATLASAADALSTIDGVDQVLEAGEALQKEVDAASEAWIELAHGSDAHSGLLPSIQEARARWSDRAWFDLTRLAELESLLGSGAPARNGVVVLDGPVDLDRSAVWANARLGRLVLVVRGAARLHDVAAPEGCSLTVVAEGALELAGRVDADIVAQRGLTVAPGARLRGHLTVLAGAVQLGERSSIERGAVGAPAAHVAIDPFAAPAEID